MRLFYEKCALDTSIATIERTRRQLVEEGFEAVLRRKYNPNSARPRILPTCRFPRRGACNPIRMAQPVGSRGSRHRDAAAGWSTRWQGSRSRNSVSKGCRLPAAPSCYTSKETANTRTGSAMFFSIASPRSTTSTAIVPRTSFQMSAETHIPPGSARPSIRATRFTAWP
jgi:hypothetical protein